MTLLSWNDSLSLGVDAMDAEHKELVAAMNRIHELAGKKADKATLDVAIQRLAKLTAKHFADEEKHMAAIGYPDAKRHGYIHQDMLQKIAAHHEAFQKGDGTVPKAFFDFLVHWLCAHIKGIDRKYADHGAPTRV
ncbi:MAG: hemerythrin family protein [Planctomycetes bacterium]|nr:hemerythrin family protein [Planctomycetota bacterium]MCB9887921.1 hemerythrin family protein [Planctomycetota bacterium]